MLFHEIYGCYFNTVARLLSFAVKGELTDGLMYRIIQESAFSESILTIVPALKKQEWKLLCSDLSTPLTQEPTMPLTDLEKRWLKAVSLDPRIQLFRVKTEGLEEVTPLFLPDDFVFFDQYGDGDPYETEAYQKHFHTILDALRQKRWLRITYTSRKGAPRRFICMPHKLEYSQKDDKFRLLTAGFRHNETVNLARILSCELLTEEYPKRSPAFAERKRRLVLALTDERNALERAMLHFAHFEKQAEKLDRRQYLVSIFYDADDETELVIRVLSFGPLVRVLEPDCFISQIKDRLLLQKSCGLR